MAKLTKTEISVIIEEIKNYQIPYKDIAKKYNITPAYISRLKKQHFSGKDVLGLRKAIKGRKIPKEISLYLENEKHDDVISELQFKFLELKRNPLNSIYNILSELNINYLTYYSEWLNYPPFVKCLYFLDKLEQDAVDVVAKEFIFNNKEIPQIRIMATKIYQENKKRTISIYNFEDSEEKQITINFQNE